ncbi:hypothetical protein ACWGDT_03380 [Streptomyces avermitilis]
MAGQFEATVEISRPVEEVFAFLADGRNDPESSGAGTTRVRIFNVLEGHGIGTLLVGFALTAARKDAAAVGQRIKAAEAAEAEAEAEAA